MNDTGSLKAGLLAAITLALLFFCGVTSIYLRNIDMFTFSFWYIIVIFLPLSVLIFFLFGVALGLSRMDRRFLNIFVPILIALAFALYFERIVMPMDYGRFDGSAINWSNYVFRSIINLLAWIIIFAVCLLFRKKNEKLFLSISASALIALCVSNIVYIGARTYVIRDSLVAPQYIFTGHRKFNISENRNIIVFILDAVDNKIFEQVLRDNPELTEIFQGFTHFDNATTVSNLTERALPYMLTNQIYTNHIGMSEFRSLAFQTTPIFRLLREQDFDNRIFTYPYKLPMQDFWESGDVKNISDATDLSFSDMLIVGRGISRIFLAQHSPVLFKRFFWLDGTELHSIQQHPDEVRFEPVAADEIVNRDIVFYRNITGPLPFAIDASLYNVFRLYHMRGAHTPFDMNEDIEPVVTTTFTPESMLAQIEGSINILGEVFTQLRNLGVWSNTDIIIVSDHGIGYNQTLGYYSPPIFLHKPAGAGVESMITSHAPVSIGDVAGTVLKAAGVGEYHVYGSAVSDMDENTERRRYFYFNDWREPSAVMDFRSTLHQFYTYGSSSDAGSWIRTENLHRPMRIDVFSSPQYSLGDNMAANGNTATRYFFRGIHVSPSSDRIYAAGSFSLIRIQLEPTERDLEVYYNFRSVFDALPQRVIITVNGSILSNEILVTADGGGGGGAMCLALTGFFFLKRKKKQS